MVDVNNNFSETNNIDINSSSDLETVVVSSTLPANDAVLTVPSEELTENYADVNPNIQKGIVKTAVKDDETLGLKAGDIYIEIIFAGAKTTRIIVPVNKLKDIYNGENGIIITNNKVSIDTTLVALKTDLQNFITEHQDISAKADITYVQQLIANYVTKTQFATENNAGIIKPDGNTVVVDQNGTLSIKEGSVSLPSQTGNTGKFLTTDGSVASWAEPLSYEVGDIVYRLLPTQDGGKHLLDGTLLSGSGIYADFVNYIAGLDLTANYFCTEAEWQQSVTTYGVCGKFVYDSVNNTVRLPKVTGIIEGTIDVTALGDLVEAGLPNITGTIVSYWGNFQPNVCEGAFNGGSSRVNAAGNGTNPGADRVNFNASASNSIYGNSATVQPQTIKGYYYIVVANSSKTNIQVDIDEVVTDLNGKAYVDFTNINNLGTSRGAGWAMPSNTYIQLTLGASGSAYTAPANGWFAVQEGTASQNTMTTLINTTKRIGTRNYTPQNWRGGNLFVPVNAGDTVSLEYVGSGYKLYFIYTKGSESEAG